MTSQIRIGTEAWRHWRTLMRPRLSAPTISGCGAERPRPHDAVAALAILTGEGDLPKSRSKNVRTDLEPDGLHVQPIKPHTRDKLFTLGYYLEEFTGAMSGRFPNLVYVDLFAGSGRGEFPDGALIDGSPLIAARTLPPFTKLILVEEHPENFTALKKRLAKEFQGRDIAIFKGNCNELAGAVRAQIPRPRPAGGVLTFCFVDPFNLSIHFSTLRRFKDLWIDFLVLVADQMAGGRSDKAFQAEGSDVVERFLDDPEWRGRWKEAEATGQKFKDFLLERFTAAMVGLGFRPGIPMRIKVQGMGVRLYRLAFFSKRDVALRFWESARRNAPAQESLI
jgi:three-Cys-motif partner protein